MGKMTIGDVESDVDDDGDGARMSAKTAEVRAIVDRARIVVDGLLPAIIQQHGTQEVLTLGYMNAEALNRTLTEGRMTRYSNQPTGWWFAGRCVRDTVGTAQRTAFASTRCTSG